MFAARVELLDWRVAAVAGVNLEGLAARPGKFAGIRRRDSGVPCQRESEHDDRVPNQSACAHMSPLLSAT